jgi:cytochrome c peroxidase
MMHPVSHQLHSLQRRLLVVAFLALAQSVVWAAVPVMRLEILPMWQGRGVVPGQKLGSESLRVTRLDAMLSRLALKRVDGSWLESQDWYRFISVDRGLLRVDADGLPAERFTALRFDVGVPSEINAVSPNQWPAGHPLHPDVCGLHWGWQGGYIFMALEGRWRSSRSTDDGFSFHLANDPNVAHVEVPVEFQGGGPLTLHLDLDIATLLEGISLEKDGASTHSRAGDPLAAKLKTNLQRAFRARGISHDLFQPAANAGPPASSLPPGTHAYVLEITERFPQVSLPSDNPLTLEGVALGRKLFHDKRLSINNTKSCASCHASEESFADSRRFSVGALGDLGRRNSMPLVNLAWGKSFFWDGRARTLREQVLMPVEDVHEMAETMDNVVSKLMKPEPSLAGEQDFAAAFGSPGITPDRIARALEQFLLTLISQDSRFDQAVRKVAELTEQEKRGLQLFVTEHDPKRGLLGADCFHCHGGTLFTDHQFHHNGLDLTADDLGRMIVSGKEEDRGKFKVPTLRNIAVTGPYMHDGRFQTLEEVVEHYSSGVKRVPNLDPNLAKHPTEGLNLSAEDKRALVAFLKTLTDESFGKESLPVKTDHRPPAAISSTSSPTTKN